jgi:Hint domain
MAGGGRGAGICLLTAAAIRFSLVPLGRWNHVAASRHGGSVIWVRYRTVDCTHQPEPREAWPVQICSGSRGRCRPSRALWLSLDHAVYIGDVPMPLKQLVNDISIVRVPVDHVTYCHGELPRHAVRVVTGRALAAAKRWVKSIAAETRRAA